MIIKQNHSRRIDCLIIALFLLSLVNCKNHQPVYRLAAGSKGTSYYKVAQNIAEIISTETGIKIELVADTLSLKGKTIKLDAINNCYALAVGAADFALAQNDVSFFYPNVSQGIVKFSNIRSVIPLYSEIFFIIYKQELNPSSLKNLVKNRKIAVGPKGSGTARLTQTVFQEFGISPSDYQFQYVNFEDNVLSDTIEISCLLTGFNNERIEKSLRRGGKIFSLGDPNLAGKGSAAEGFCLKYPLAKPFIIPTNIFSDLPEEPVLTIAIDAVLLTRENVARQVVFNFVETLLNTKQYLVVDLNNRILSQITEQFDPLKLRFPLHRGAKDYLERNRPTFLERYSESLGFLFSLAVAFIGGITTLARWNRRRKKNRIDTFYRGVMNIETRIPGLTTESDCQRTIQALKHLRQNAFEHLIDEKLTADESFRIFITFLNDTKKDITQRIQEIKGRA